MATHEGIITFFPDVRWEALQQLEPVVLRLPECVQDRPLQNLACRREGHDSGFRIQGSEEACNCFDYPLLLKKSGDHISLRHQNRVGVNRADDPVVGTGHIRAIVVAGEGKNNIDLDEPNEGHVITRNATAPNSRSNPLP